MNGGLEARNIAPYVPSEVMGPEVPADIVPMELGGQTAEQAEVVQAEFDSLVQGLENEVPTLSQAELDELHTSTMPKSGNTGDIAFAKS